MANLVDLLKSQMSQDLIGQLTNQIGADNPNQTANASNAIFSILTNALANNVQKRDGAAPLINAIEKDHDGSILNNLGDLFKGADMNMNNRTTNGVGILGHLLGNRQNSAIDMIAKATGLNNNTTAALMVKLAPMVLGMLGKQKQSNHMNQGGLVDFITNSAQQTNRQLPKQNQDMLSRFLDQDGDGSAMDDIAGMGMKVLGNLFR